MSEYPKPGPWVPGWSLTPIGKLFIDHMFCQDWPLVQRLSNHAILCGVHGICEVKLKGE